jgi:hypothetical protein
MDKVTIEIKNSEISGSLLNRVRINDNARTQIKIEDTNISESAEVLNDLELGRVLDILQDKIKYADRNSNEYKDLLDIMKMRNENKNAIRDKIGSHLIAFSEGVLANIISNFILLK